jgi:acyl-CoA thioesterase-1
MLIFLLCSLAIIAIPASAFAAEPSIPDSSIANRSILVYGDSLSAAYGIPRERGWVTLLQQRLHQQGYSYQVINASISGETTSGGTSRINASLKQVKPDLILLELGANDGLRGLPVAEMQHNLNTMIKAGQAVGARILLIGIMIPPNYGPKYTRQFSESFPDLAKRYNLPLVPFLLDGIAGKPTLTQDDGLHPTAAAQGLILENVWKVLEPELLKLQAKKVKAKP